MISKKNVLFLLILAFGNCVGQRYNYRFINFGSKDGLESNFTYSCEQDNQGYMWFATGAGLFRYDNKKFKKFSSPLNKPNSTIDDILQVIKKDAHGNLWLASLNSLQFYNPSKHIFWQPKKMLDYDKVGYIQNIYIGKKTWLYTTKSFVMFFNEKDSSFQQFSNKYPPNASKRSMCIVEHADKVYDFHEEALYVFHANGELFSQIAYPFSDISNIYFNKKEQQVYFTTYQKAVHILNLNSGSFQKLSITNPSIDNGIYFSIIKNSKGDIFIAGYGVQIINKNNSIQWYSKQNAKLDNDLKSNKFASLFLDREENLWLCGFEGLSMLPWQNKYIDTIPLSDIHNKYSTEVIKLYQSPEKDEVLITSSTSSGLQVLKDNQVTTIRNPNGYQLPVDRLFEKSIKFMFIRKDKRVFATDYDNFFEYNLDKKTLVNYPLLDQNNKPIFKPKDGIEDDEGNLYIGSRNNGFYIWNTATDKLVHYNIADISKDTSYDNVILPCFKDSKKNIWFKSNNGIFKFDAQQKRYFHLGTKNEGDVPKMGETTSVAEDENGNIWVTSRTNGIYQINASNQILDLQNSLNNKSISNNVIWNLQKDPKNNFFWVSTINGLSKFDPSRKILYGTMNLQNGMAMDDGGYGFNIINNKLYQIYFGVLNSIDLENFPKNNFSPKPVFTSIKTLDKELSYTIDTNNAQIVLQPNQNYLELEFNSLVYNNGNKNIYLYKLDGVDRDWKIATNNNAAIYNGLQAGGYTFYVKAINNDGVESQTTTLEITIKKVFYKTWWFIGLVSLSLIGLFYAWYKNKIAQHKKEAQLKQQLAATELKALRAQMNPHFIFNSLNSIQKYIFKNEHFEASQYLTKFSRLIRLILDQSNQNTILLSSEIDLLKLYVEMETLRFENKFDFEIQIDPQLNQEASYIPSMLVQPYVENAIWHGLLHKEEKGKLSINFSLLQNNLLLVEIIDNGIGRERAMELKSKQVLKKKSYGMQITEDRIATINKTLGIAATCKIVDLKNEEGLPLGTKVELKIPIQNN
jgi:ligand-binding sensor domain-containing protein